MVDNKDCFVLSLKLKKGVEEHGHVYYKQDGQRFDYSCTIKLNVETTYHFTLTLRPKQTLESVSVRDTAVSLSDVQIKEDSSIYTFPFTTTGFEITKHKLRTAVPLTLKVKGMGIINITLQIKFYDVNDKNHSIWGNALHHIDYECEAKSNRMCVDVVKEIYR